MFGVVLLILLPWQSRSQFRFSEYELNAGPGYTVANHPEFPDVNEVSLIGSLRATGRFNGNKAWHKNYNFPYLSIQATGASLGNSDVLGYYTGLMADINFRSKGWGDWYMEYTAGMGVAWFSEPYDEIENPDNVVIGSAVTFSANAAISLVRKLNDHSSVHLKALVIHCSNSHYQLPNVGLNLPGLTIGYRYRMNDMELVENLPESPGFDRRWRPNIRIALGLNEQGSSTIPVNGPKYPIYLATFYMSKKFTPVNKFYTGLEYYFNTGSKDFILSQKFYEDKINKRSSVITLTFGHEFLFGHMSVVTTLGLNIYNKFHQDRLKAEEITSLKEKFKTYVPARLGFQYYFKDATVHHSGNLFTGIYIKSNFGQADFLEMSLGYTF